MIIDFNKRLIKRGLTELGLPEISDSLRGAILDQVHAVEDALLKTIEKGSPTAGDDKLIIVIEGQQYEISLWPVDVVNAFFNFLTEVKEVNTKPELLTCDLCSKELGEEETETLGNYVVCPDCFKKEARGFIVPVEMITPAADKADAAERIIEALRRSGGLFEKFKISWEVDTENVVDPSTD